MEERSNKPGHKLHAAALLQLLRKGKFDTNTPSSSSFLSSFGIYKDMTYMTRYPKYLYYSLWDRMFQERKKLNLDKEIKLKIKVISNGRKTYSI